MWGLEMFKVQCTFAIMPQYHIFSRLLKSKEEYESIGIISGSGAKSAWNKFKRWAKQNNKPVDPFKEYHLYPINHCRVWKIKSNKWTINSFYGNHDAKRYRKQQSEAMAKAFKSKHRVKHQS